MAATAYSSRMGTALALGVALLATLSAVFVLVTDADAAESYDGTHDLYGYKITMGLIEPDQVASVEWDFGDGSETVTVQITSDNPVGQVQHVYAEKGDYVVTATMRNQYTDPSTGELKDGESKLVYLYHIFGYPVVTFDSNGGSSVASIEGTSAHYVPTKPSDPMKNGFGFSGWYTDSECTKPFDWTSEVTKHITLYAGWSATFYTVSFDYDGGVGSASDLRIADGKTATAPENPTKEGFDFDGWYLGDEKYDFSTPITSDITLTAHWKAASEPTQDDDKNESSTWVVFVILAFVCILALFVTGFYIIGIPAALFAILAIVSYLGVI